MELSSPLFLALVVCAVLVMPALPDQWKGALFLALNVTFVASYWRWPGLLVGLAFCLAGYIAARSVRNRGALALGLAIGTLTAGFVVLRPRSLDGSGDAHVAGLAVLAGLSFLFFRMLHVVVDSSSGILKPMSLGSYLNYCLNFTTFLMGPLQRYQDFAAQWKGEAPPVAEGFEAHLDATNRALRGAVKAFALAPLIAPFALQSDVSVETLSARRLLFETYAFYVVLYLDFSGYCDLVIGIGTLMGIRPPENFRFPFLSRNVSEYWLRVHRSLTLWLTDYVFTPIYRWAIGTRALGAHAFLALAAALVATMLVAGAWHGTSANFLMFGLVHGVALVVMRGYEQLMTRWMGRNRFRRYSQAPLVSAAAVFLTYNFTSLAYVFFVLDLPRSLRLIERVSAAAIGGTL
jgi:D-alanyl-lipoteichoic acid acyltransferase DltB (MBOAT superfamily)